MSLQADRNKLAVLRNAYVKATAERDRRYEEWEYLNEDVPVDVDTQSNKIITNREGKNLFLIGGGYTSGGKVASEIYILYDVLSSQSSVDLPLIYRFGITLNF